MVPTMLTFPDRSFDDPFSGFIGEVLTKLLGRVTTIELPLQEGRIQRFKPKNQMQVPNIFGSNLTIPDPYKFLFVISRSYSGKCTLNAFHCYPSVSIKLPILLIRQIAISSKKVFASSNGLIKRQIFQSVNRVLSDHGSHGPKRCNQFTSLFDHMKEMYPFFLGQGLKPLRHRFRQHEPSSYSRCSVPPNPL